MRRKFGFVRPDLSEQHIVVQFGKFRGERAEAVAPCGLFLGISCSFYAGWQAVCKGFQTAFSGVGRALMPDDV